MDYKDVKNVAKQFCYQHVCQGKPEWSSNIDLTEDTKTHQKCM